LEREDGAGGRVEAVKVVVLEDIEEGGLGGDWTIWQRNQCHDDACTTGIALKLMPTFMSQLSARLILRIHKIGTTSP
jgi:hypothetical protein